MLTISKSFIAEHNFRWCYWRSWDENNVSVTQPRSQEERPWEQGCLLPTFACFLRSRTLLQYSLVPRSSPWRDPGNEVVNTLVWYRCLQELCKWWYLVLYSWAYCKLPCTLSSTLHLALKFPKIKESRTCQLMATEMFEGLINIYWGQKIWIKVYGWTRTSVEYSGPFSFSPTVKFESRFTVGLNEKGPEYSTLVLYFY